MESTASVLAVPQIHGTGNQDMCLLRLSVVALNETKIMQLRPTGRWITRLLSHLRINMTITGDFESGMK
jgi:hypothetical protein